MIINPQEFFSEQLSKAIGEQNKNINPLVFCYLIDLLSNFINIANYNQKPLAFILKEALESENPNINFKYLGDFSLYTAGIFPDSLRKKLVDIDYYVDMGRNAYSYLSKENDIYKDLSNNFVSIIDIFNQLSEEMFVLNTNDLLRIYEIWQLTNSPRLKKKLSINGIIIPDSNSSN